MQSLSFQPQELKEFSKWLQLRKPTPDECLKTDLVAEFFRDRPREGIHIEHNPDPINLRIDFLNCYNPMFCANIQDLTLQNLPNTIRTKISVLYRHLYGKFCANKVAAKRVLIQHKEKSILAVGMVILCLGYWRFQRK